jgi:hypothetical protein
VFLTQQQQLRPLPWQTSYNGNPRRFGIEIEFSGLELNDVQQLVAEHLSLSGVPSGRYRHKLTGDSAGDWLVELDFQLLTKMGEQKLTADSLGDSLYGSLETMLATVAKQLVPLELVSPPLPYERLAEIVELISMLRQAGAKGSSESLQYAFGLQLNPEVPTTDVSTLLRVIQAFVCLHDWLRLQEKIDFTRNLTSYIAPYAKAYQLHIIDKDYQPNLAELIDTYLEHNPSRNYALDCLPLFLHLDKQRVRAITDDELIKARPTFHYRLPSCEIHQAEWGLSRAWNGWAEVEMLAAEPERLQRCMAAYRQQLTKAGNNVKQWINEVEQQWLSR